MASSQVSVGSKVEHLIDAAARRRLLVVSLEHAGWAAIGFLAGFILLILTGSLIFHWEWLLLLALAGLCFAAYRIRQARLSRYCVAQMVDRKLATSDTLSTAYFLQQHTDLAAAPALAYQLEQAEKLAAGISPAQTFAFAGRRIWTIAGALALLSIGLFAVRYMVTESLSLRPALITLQVAPVIEKIHEVLSPRKDPHSLEALADRPRTKAGEAEGKEAQSNRPTEPPATPPGISNATPDGAPAGQQQQASGAKKEGGTGESQPKPGEPSLAKNEAPGETGSAAAPQPGDASNKPGAQQGTKTQEQQNANSQNTPPGMVSRMKEALSSMMAKMQTPSASQQGKNGQQQESTDSKNSQQAQASGRPQQGKQSQQQEAQNQSANPNENAEGQAQGQTAEKQGTAQGKSSDQSAQKGSDAHSGVGQQDGDKDLKNAEQLKAMGKLAEIIGKRSSELTGDMTVETSSGKQQLKTGYSNRLGQHSDSGGEINHNQVPLAYRSYVRNYMEHVRRPE